MTEKYTCTDTNLLLDTHKAVKTSGKYNFEVCRIPIYSRMHIQYSRSMLIDFKDQDGLSKEAILEEFEYVMFHIGTHDIGKRGQCNAIISDFGNLLAVFRKEKPGIKIMISAILSRPVDHATTNSINRRVNSYLCKNMSPNLSCLVIRF